MKFFDCKPLTQFEYDRFCTDLNHFNSYVELIIIGHIISLAIALYLILNRPVNAEIRYMRISNP